MCNLPIEIWALVFENLEEKELWNVYHSCIQWKCLLESTRSKWMFGQVLPNLLPYFLKQDVLQCRSICKTWCETVDNFLENTHSTSDVTRYGENFQNNNVLRKLSDSIFCEFEEPEQFTKFLQEAEHHVRSPFVGKFVKLSSVSFPPLNLYTEQLLKIHGHHIKYLHLEVISSPNPLEFLKQLFSILCHLPNLERLHSTFELDIWQDFNSLYYENQIKTYGRNSLSKIVHKLPKLKYIYIDGHGPYSDIIRETVISTFQWSIQSLHLVGFPSFSKIPRLMDMTNLELSVSRNQHLDNMLSLKAHLKCLVLTVNGHVSAEMVFQAISRFKSTISHLTLNLTQQSSFYVKNFKYQFHDPLRVPAFIRKTVIEEMKHLKSVRLSGCSPISVNFLYGLRNTLEFLFLDITDTNPRKFKTDSFPWIENQEILDLLVYFRRQLKHPDSPLMYGSNVWQIFTKLKVLVMKNIDGKLLEFRRGVHEKI